MPQTYNPCEGECWVKWGALEQVSSPSYCRDAVSGCFSGGVCP